MSQAAEFEADVRVGRGIIPLAQHGKLTVKDGVVTIWGSSSKIIASAPIADVVAKGLPFPLHGLRVTINGTGYNLDGAISRVQTVVSGRLLSNSTGKTTTLVKGFVAFLDAAKSTTP